jgi:hypothetical protein
VVISDLRGYVQEPQLRQVKLVESMRRAVSAPFALLALTALTVGAYGAAEHAVIVGQEPNWNSEHWEQDKTYYSTWAHLHFCVDPSSSVRDLDSLRAVMLVR